MWLQSCTEMVMPVCSDGVNDMFESKPWNLTQIIADCHKRWNVSPRPHWIVEQYGGKNISAASDIIFRLDDRSVLIFCYFYPCDTILAMDVFWRCARGWGRRESRGMLREYHGDGSDNCGMDFITA